MALFSVLHLFAFPWKEYSIKHNSNMLTAPGSGFSGESPAKYRGGFLGIYAIADAFNPWDIVKASARGFRWLFVGVKQRHLDPSYQQAPGGKLADNTRYTGGVGDSATELRPSDDGRIGRPGMGVDGSPEDDRAGLLGNPARMSGRQTSPYPPSPQPHSAAHPYLNDDSSNGHSSLDIGAHQPYHPPSHAYDSKPSEWAAEDTGYHPGIGPSGVHPALRDQEDLAPPQSQSQLQPYPHHYQQQQQQGNQGGARWTQWSGTQTAAMPRGPDMI